MNWHLFIDVLRNSILITGLVLIMMLMIEYFNIHSHGKWFRRIQDSKIKQIFLGEHTRPKAEHVHISDLEVFKGKRSVVKLVES